MASAASRTSSAVTRLDDYNHEEHKFQANIRWLISKVTRGADQSVGDIRDPFYRNEQGELSVKPSILQFMTSGVWYCQVAAVIFNDNSFLSAHHGAVLQALKRLGISVDDAGGNGGRGEVTETVLAQDSPPRLNAHVAVIDALMLGSFKRMVTTERVIAAVKSHVHYDPSEFPNQDKIEDNILFWINKICAHVRSNLEQEGIEAPIPEIDDLYEDWYDLCCVATLISFYRPQRLKFNDITFSDDMEVGDCLRNIGLVKQFCASLPGNIFHFASEDVLYTHESFQPNILAFLNDLFVTLESANFKTEVRPPPPTSRGFHQPSVQPIPDLRGGGSSRPAQSFRLGGMSVGRAGGAGMMSGATSLMNSVDSLATQRSVDSLKYNRAMSMNTDRGHMAGYQHPGVSGPGQVRRSETTSFGHINNGNPMNQQGGMTSSQYNPHHPQHQRINPMSQQFGNSEQSGGFVLNPAGGGSLSSHYYAAQQQNQPPPMIGDYSRNPNSNNYRGMNGNPSNNEYNSGGYSSSSNMNPSSHHLEFRGANYSNSNSIDNNPHNPGNGRHPSTSMTQKSASSSLLNASIRLQLDEKRRLIEQKKFELESTVNQDRDKKSKEAFFLALKSGAAAAAAGSKGVPTSPGSSMSQSMYVGSASIDGTGGAAARIGRSVSNRLSSAASVQSLSAAQQQQQHSQYPPGAGQHQPGVRHPNHLSGSHDQLGGMSQQFSASQLDISRQVAELQNEIKRLSMEQQQITKRMQFDEDGASSSGAPGRRSPYPPQGGPSSGTSNTLPRPTQRLIAYTNEAPEFRLHDGDTPPDNSPGGQSGGRRQKDPSLELGHVTNWGAVGLQQMTTSAGPLTNIPPVQSSYQPPAAAAGHHQPPLRPPPEHPGAQQGLIRYKTFARDNSKIDPQLLPQIGSPQHRPPSVNNNNGNNYNILSSNPIGQYPPYDQGQNGGAEPGRISQSAMMVDNSKFTNGNQGFYGEDDDVMVMSSDPNVMPSMVSPGASVVISGGASSYSPSRAGGTPMMMTHHPQRSMNVDVAGYAPFVPPSQPGLSPQDVGNYQSAQLHHQPPHHGGHSPHSDNYQQIDVGGGFSSPKGTPYGMTPTDQFVPHQSNIQQSPLPGSTMETSIAGHGLSGMALDITFEDDRPGTVKSKPPVLSSGSGTPGDRKGGIPSSEGGGGDGRGGSYADNLVPASTPPPSSHHRDASPADYEQQKRKEQFLMSQIKRRAQLDERKRTQEQEQAEKRIQLQVKQEDEERKKLERELKRQKIFDDYQKKKSEQEMADNPPAPLRPKQTTGTGSASGTPLGSARGHSQPPARPKSQMIPQRRGPHEGSLPPVRGANSVDDIDQLDTGSQPGSDGGASEPALKLFVKPTAKSNRSLIINALTHCVLAGVVNDEQKRKVFEELAKSDSKHFLVLFRDYKCQYRGLYSWDQLSDVATKLHGTGPKSCSETMMELMFKYDSGGKKFGKIPSRHLSATIDGFTLHDQYWQKKKVPGYMRAKNE